MTKTKSTQLNCFSPPVMVATLIIEFSAAIYTIWRYKMSVATRIISSLLVSLATFQLAEYFVCTGSGHAEAWSRVGFVAISALPALGTHLMHVLAGKPKRKAVVLAYATMVGFSIFFLTYSGAFVGHQCTGNYVIFQLGEKIGGTYALGYYYLWLAFGLFMGARWANELQDKGKLARKQLESVRGLMVGYLVFMVPCAIWNTLDAASRPAIPSIMCGFAVLLALILTLYILPRVSEPKSAKG
jgi:predicted permease